MKEKYQKLIRNLQFYHNNRAQFEQQYQGKYLLIWEEVIAGIYLTYEEALAEASSQLDPGTYLLKYCEPEAKEQKVYAVNGIFRAATMAMA